MTQYLTKEEAASYMSVSQGTLDRWAREGRITRYKPNGWAVRYRTDELDALAKPQPRPKPRNDRERYPSEHGTWLAMIRRCKNTGSKDYGGRGIRVCDEWMNDFSAFVAYVGPKPEPKHEYSLDRIDVNGHYEPGNVRWATHQEQFENKRPHHNPVFGRYEDGRYTKAAA